MAGEYAKCARAVELVRGFCVDGPADLENSHLVVNVLVVVWIQVQHSVDVGKVIFVYSASQFGREFQKGKRLRLGLFDWFALDWCFFEVEAR